MSGRLHQLVATAAMTMMSLAARGEPPDLTGIWMPTAIKPDGERHRIWPEQLPFLDDVQKQVDRYMAEYDPVIDDFGRTCLPYGMPRQMLITAQYPLEIIETEDRITMLFEMHNDVRRIYLDGRQHPEGWLPTWMGHSIGHYDGDTLVIGTTGIRTNGPPRPRSPAHKVTERINLIDGGERGRMLTVDVTIDDPAIYRAPFTVRNYFWEQTDFEIGEYFCSDDLWQQNLRGDRGRLPWR